MKKEMGVWIFCQSLFIVLFFSACGKESTEPEPPDKTRAEYLWLNETIALAPGNDTTFSRPLLTDDTLHVSVGLLNQYTVSSLSLRNSEDSIFFSETEVESEHFYIRIPASDTFTLSLEQQGNLTEFQLYARIIRWEYRP